MKGKIDERDFDSLDELNQWVSEDYAFPIEMISIQKIILPFSEHNTGTTEERTQYTLFFKELL